MPAAITYIDDVNDKAARALDKAFDDEMRVRRTEYDRSWKYYWGKHDKHLQEDKTNTRDNVVVNLVELLIDKGVSSLMGTTDQGTVKGPDFDVVEPEAEKPAKPELSIVQKVANGAKALMQPKPKHADEDSEADKWLEKVWEANFKAIFLHNLAVSGGVCGHNFVKVMPEGATDPDDDDKKVPRLVALNPANVAVFWHHADMQRVLWYRVQYTQSEITYRQDVIRLRDEKTGADLPKWTIRDYTRGGINPQGGKTSWALVSEVDWEYAWSPIIDWPNLPRPNEYYGCNDIRTSGNLNDGLNFVASNMQRIIKHHAHPKTIGTGFKVEDLKQSGVDRMWAISAAEAKIYNLEMQSDLGSSLNYMHFLRQAFFDSGRELDPATVQDKLGAMTNFGLRVLFKDSLEKTGTKRLLYGLGLRCACKYMLELGGFGANLKVKDTWPDPLPTDALATAQALEIDRANGMSQHTYLEKRGLDPDVERERREQEIAEGAMRDTMATQGAMLEKYRKARSEDERQPAGANGAANGAAAGPANRMVGHGY